MSLANRKILYDKLVAEGKVDEANSVIKYHPELAKVEEPKEDKPKKDGIRRKGQ